MVAVAEFLRRLFGGRKPEEEDGPRGLAQALARFDAVLCVNPRLAPAWHNKALALEFAERPSEEAAAWRGYLKAARGDRSQRKFIPRAEARLRDIEGR